MHILRMTALFVLATPLFGQGNSYGLTLHVTATHTGLDCSSFNGNTLCRPTQTLQVTVDGRHFELQGTTLRPKGLVPLGDYPGRLADDPHKPTGEFTREYTLRFPDGSTRTFDVIGEHE